MTTRVPLEVAVVGGGIGGLCLAIGLLQHSHIRVQIYEAAHAFSEIGAGVALGPNAIQALGLIAPQAKETFDLIFTGNLDSALKHTWFSFYYGTGPKVDTFIAAPRNERGQLTVHRAKFLESLVELLPPGIAQFNKRLSKLEEVNEHGRTRVRLHFNDGTTASADCAVGADGVHSVVRQHILGEDHPATNATFTGTVAYRGLVPMNEAIAALGEVYARNAHVWLGNGGIVMIFPIDFGETMNIVVVDCSVDQWEGPWVQPVKYEKVAAAFSEWTGLSKKVVELLNTPTTKAWSLWHHLSTPTYCDGHICMMGDAAHASTPFQGQGAGQAIEDAFVLSSVLGNVDGPHNISVALRAYDKIRRPRSQLCCKTSRENGEVLSLRFPGVMDDAAALKENLDWRMDWLWHRDIAGEAHETNIIYQSLLAGHPVF